MKRGLLETMALPQAFPLEKEVLMNQLSKVKPGAFLSSRYFIDTGILRGYARALRELPIITKQDKSLHRWIGSST